MRAPDRTPPMPAIEPVTLRTERLTLRVPEARDRAAIYAMRSHPDVCRYASGVPWQSMDEADAWLARSRTGRENGHGLELVIEREPGAPVIGSCAVFAIHEGSRRGELGYSLHRDHWGHGYATEATRALIAHAFDADGLDLRRLEADIDPANEASERVLRRLGFSHEGRLRERWDVAGVISDSDLFGLLRREWLQP
jgi:[ribosomal protein S5]-alanine N-acetyltransferase